MSFPSPLLPLQPPPMEIVPSREPEQMDVAPTSFIGAVEPLPATTARERKFEEVYTRGFAPMHHTCNRLLGDPDAAKDVVQDTMFDFYQKWDTLPLEKRTDAYMMQAARFRAMDALRRRRNRRETEYTGEIEERGEVPVVELPDMLGDIEAAAQRVVSAMPQRCREMFVLVTDYELTQKEAAETLGISYETARTHYKRAVGILRKSLAARPDLLQGRSLPRLGSGRGENDHD